jgi:hypothetical protein
MRTKRLRRWVAGLSAAATLGIGALSLTETMYAAYEFQWQTAVTTVHSWTSAA